MQSAGTAGAARTLRRYEDLPGPRGLPLVGNSLQLDAPRLHQQMERWCREYGPIYRLRFGRRRMIVIGEHETVAAVLRDRPDGFRRTSRLEQIWTEMGLKPGVFGANGDSWRRQRRMVMASFDPAHIKSYFASLCAVGQRLSRRWQDAARERRAIDLQADLMRYTVDTIAGLAFGTPVNTLESNEDIIQNHLDKIFPALWRRMTAALPTWRLFPSRADRELAQGILAVNAAVDTFIADARERLRRDPARAKEPPNLLEAMIVAADEPDSGIDDRLVSGNVLTMLLAGEDTTANTIAWMIYLLWRNPEALANAADEVRRTIADPMHPKQEELARLDYVEACAHETMRLKPVAPLLGLQALRDTTIGDVRVPAGMMVFSLMRRDSVSDEFVPEASAFLPERWLTEGGPRQAASAAKRISMPFGAGPRICPGRYLALLEMKMAMAMLLGHFDIESVTTPYPGEAKEHMSFTMAPVDLRLRLKLRGTA
jgi:cytochrome P450